MKDKSIKSQYVDLTSFDIVDNLSKLNIKDSKSDVLSLPSHSSDDFIGFSDVPIMQVMSASTENTHDKIHSIPNMFVPNVSKPQGSGFISV